MFQYLWEEFCWEAKEVIEKGFFEEAQGGDLRHQRQVKRKYGSWHARNIFHEYTHSLIKQAQGFEEK